MLEQLLTRHFPARFYPKGYTRLPDAPIELGSNSLTYGEGHVYGYGNYPYSDLVLRYSVADRKWDTVPQSGTRPIVRFSTGLAYLDGKLYVLGGKNGSTILSDFWSLDIETGIWETLPAPGAVHSHSLRIMRGKILLIGGENGIHPNQYTKRDLREYDPELRTWITLASMPAESMLHSPVVRDGELFLYGGAWSERVSGGIRISGLSSLRKYDRDLNTWEALSPLLPNRYDNNVMLVRENIISLEGTPKIDIKKAISIFSLDSGIWNTRGHEGTEKVDYPERIYGRKSIQNDNDLYLLGANSPPSKEFWVYSV